jgi:hypothetical protein
MNQMSPVSGIPVIKSKPGSDDLLKIAMQYRLEQKYTEACNIYKSLISSPKDKKESISSIIGLLNIYRENTDNSIMKYLESLNNPEGEINAITMSALLNGYALDGNMERTKAIADKIQKEYPKSEQEKFALLQLAYLQKFNLKDEKSADNILTEIESKFTDDEDILTAKWLIRGSGKRVNDKNGNSIKDSILQNNNNQNLSVQNYPNPFNPSTKISYSIPDNSIVKLVIYNSMGQEVETLVNKFQAQGKYEIEWIPKNLASGIYYYKLSVNDHSEIKKLIFIK